MKKDLLNTFKNNLISEGMVNRNMVISLEESYGEALISSKVNINKLSMSLSTIGYNDVLSIVENKLLENGTISNEDADLRSDVNLDDSILNISENTLAKLSHLRMYYDKYINVLKRLDKSAFFESVGKNTLTKEKDKVFIKIGDLEPRDLVEDIDLLTLACNDRVDTEFDLVYAFLKNITTIDNGYANVEDHPLKERLLIYNSYHCLEEISRICVPYESVRVGRTSSTYILNIPLTDEYYYFNHEEISNNKGLLYLCYVFKFLASLDIEALKQYVVFNLFNTTDRKTLVYNYNMVNRLSQIFESLNNILPSNNKSE